MQPRTIRADKVGIRILLETEDRSQPRAIQSDNGGIQIPLLKQGIRISPGQKRIRNTPMKRRIEASAGQYKEKAQTRTTAVVSGAKAKVLA